jgi:hypothetical protein
MSEPHDLPVLYRGPDGALAGLHFDPSPVADRNLREQFAKAKAAVHAAREVAANTPVEVKAAHTAFDQARARYQAGLAPIDDLAQA